MIYIRIYSYTTLYSIYPIVLAQFRSVPYSGHVLVFSYKCSGALDMAKLVFTLGELNAHFRPLVLALKQFCRAQSLTSERPAPLFSNFMLTMMLVFYLQNVHRQPAAAGVGLDLRGPLLPPLRQLIERNPNPASGDLPYRFQASHDRLQKIQASLDAANANCTLGAPRPALRLRYASVPRAPAVHTVLRSIHYWNYINNKFDYGDGQQLFSLRVSVQSVMYPGFFN